jgi:outer membrane protein TolC
VVRRQEGTATELDVARAAVEVEGMNRNVADERLVIALARRTLKTFTGLEPSGDVPELVDDLHAESSLESWEQRAGQAPNAKLAAELAKAAEKQASAGKLSLWPTIGATATEQATNAPGFVGHSVYLTAMVTAAWHLDVPTFARNKGYEAAAESARVQQESATDRSRDAIHEAWQRVVSGIAASRAARSQASAARLAAETARTRYAGGASTQLELIQAQRDLASTEATRIMADANLGLQRVLLHLAAGER